MVELAGGGWRLAEALRLKDVWQTSRFVFKDWVIAFVLRIAIKLLTKVPNIRSKFISQIRIFALKCFTKQKSLIKQKIISTQHVWISPKHSMTNELYQLQQRIITGVARSTLWRCKVHFFPPPVEHVFCESDFATLDCLFLKAKQIFNFHQQPSLAGSGTSRRIQDEKWVYEVSTVDGAHKHEIF